VTYDALVIGAGIAGLSTLWRLQKLGLKRVGLVEQFSLGHDRGSSHGTSRVTRSAYVDAHYVRLMQRAHRESWPELEAESGRRLIHRCDGAIFGPPEGNYAKYVAALDVVRREVEVDVEELSPQQARERFPLHTFPDASGVLHDRTAGLVAADDSTAALARLARKGGADILENTAVLAIEPGSSPIRVQTSTGPIFTHRLVVTAGPWVGKLFPDLAPKVVCVLQTVGFFELDAPPQHVQLGSFPVWYHLGAGENGEVYGLPEYGRKGIKAARYRIVGADDPDAPLPDPAADLADIRQFIGRHIRPEITALAGHEFCRFSATVDEHFRLEHHADNARIVIGSGFSGHGFKFGPLLGRILAEMVTEGSTSIPEFESARHLFHSGSA